MNPYLGSNLFITILKILIHEFQMISSTSNNSDTNNAKSSVGKSKGQSIGAPHSSMTLLHVKISTLTDSDVVRHIKCPHFLSDFDDRDLFFSMIFP